MSLTFDEKTTDPEVQAEIKKYNEAVGLAAILQTAENSYKSHLGIVSKPLGLLLKLNTKTALGTGKQWRDSHLREILDEYEQIRTYSLRIKERFENEITADEMARIDTVKRICEGCFDKLKEEIDIQIPSKPSLPNPRPRVEDEQDDNPVPQPDNCCMRVLRCLGCC